MSKLDPSDGDMDLKLIVKKIDKKFFRGVFRKKLHKRRAAKSIFLSPYIMMIHYDKSRSYLSELFETYGSDKGSNLTTPHAETGWPPHTYADLYELLFDHCRFSMNNILECGIGTNNTSVASNMGSRGRPGASLRAWRDYFPNANIVGLDVDPTSLFVEERITTYQVDQLSRESITEFWSGLHQKEFDVIIDDGLHTFKAGKSLFENSFEHLKAGGLYIIEDIRPVDKSLFTNWLQSLEVSHQLVELFRPDTELLDNSMFIIRKSLA